MVPSKSAAPPVKALALIVISGLAAMSWRRFRRLTPDLDARTRARLAARRFG